MADNNFIGTSNLFEVDDEYIDAAENLLKYTTVSIVKRGTEEKLVASRYFVDIYDFEIKAIATARNSLMISMLENAQHGDTASFDRVLKIYSELAEHEIAAIQDYITWYYVTFDCLSNSIIYGPVVLQPENTAYDTKLTIGDIRSCISDCRRHKFDFRLITTNLTDVDLRIEVSPVFFDTLVKTLSK